MKLFFGSTPRLPLAVCGFALAALLFSCTKSNKISGSGRLELEDDANTAAVEMDFNLGLDNTGSLYDRYELAIQSPEIGNKPYKQGTGLLEGKILYKVKKTKGVKLLLSLYKGSSLYKSCTTDPIDLSQPGDLNVSFVCVDKNGYPFDPKTNQVITPAPTQIAALGDLISRVAEGGVMLFEDPTSGWWLQFSRPSAGKIQLELWDNATRTAWSSDPLSEEALKSLASQPANGPGLAFWKSAQARPEDPAKATGAVVFHFAPPSNGLPSVKPVQANTLYLTPEHNVWADASGNLRLLHLNLEGQLTQDGKALLASGNWFTRRTDGHPRLSRLRLLSWNAGGWYEKGKTSVPGVSPFTHSTYTTAAASLRAKQLAKAIQDQGSPEILALQGVGVPATGKLTDLETLLKELRPLGYEEVQFAPQTGKGVLHTVLTLVKKGSGLSFSPGGVQVLRWEKCTKSPQDDDPCSTSGSDTLATTLLIGKSSLRIYNSDLQLTLSSAQDAAGVYDLAKSKWMDIFKADLAANAVTASPILLGTFSGKDYYQRGLYLDQMKLSGNVSEKLFRAKDPSAQGLFLDGFSMNLAPSGALVATATDLSAVAAPDRVYVSAQLFGATSGLRLRDGSFHVVGQDPEVRPDLGRHVAFTNGNGLPLESQIPSNPDGTPKFDEVSWHRGYSHHLPLRIDIFDLDSFPKADPALAFTLPASTRTPHYSASNDPTRVVLVDNRSYPGGNTPTLCTTWAPLSKTNFDELHMGQCVFLEWKATAESFITPNHEYPLGTPTPLTLALLKGVPDLGDTLIDTRAISALMENKVGANFLSDLLGKSISRVQGRLSVAAGKPAIAIEKIDDVQK